MSRTRTVAMAVCGAVALAGSVLTAAAAPAEPDAVASSGRGGRASGAGEYVVAFDGDADAVRRAVAGAGGQVVDVNERVGAALATAGGGEFADDVLSQRGVTGVARNHAVGTSRPGQPHRFAGERPTRGAGSYGLAGRHDGVASGVSQRGSDPLAGRQWDMDMIGATADGAHREVTGRGVRVGIIDTGVDASHPDLAPNVDVAASRNFVTDIPAVDGPCEVASCVDPADVDGNGHGTHVAGTVAAARNGMGITGVAPNATIVNLRAGQDSGYFFLYQTVAALTYAGDAGLDVANMSFYTDPWLYNCDSHDDYVEGTVSDRELAEQALTRRLVLEALDYAHGRGVTLVGAAGNEGTDLAAPVRRDEISPDYPGGRAHPRTVSDDCLDLPVEGPNVISVSAVGPSGAKAGYSNYGLGDVDLAAPGGDTGDGAAGSGVADPANLILSSYPLDVAVAEGLADAQGRPVDGTSVRDCDATGVCGYYAYLQGTSMASPHVAGVAALIIEAGGRGTSGVGYSLDPKEVAGVLSRTARDQPCPSGGGMQALWGGRPPAGRSTPCAGTPELNGFYGEGIVDAAAAVGGGR